MCDKVVSKERFMLKYFHDRCNTQEMCDKAADAYLPSLKLVLDQFFTNKMLEKLNEAVFCNNDIVFADIDSDIVNINNINIDDDNFDNYDSENITHIRLITRCNRYK